MRKMKAIKILETILVILGFTASGEWFGNEVKVPVTVRPRQ